MPSSRLFAHRAERVLAEGTIDTDRGSFSGWLPATRGGGSSLASPDCSGRPARKGNPATPGRQHSTPAPLQTIQSDADRSALRKPPPRHARTLYGTWGDRLEIDNLFFIPADKRLGNPYRQPRRFTIARVSIDGIK